MIMSGDLVIPQKVIFICHLYLFCPQSFSWGLVFKRKWGGYYSAAVMGYYSAAVMINYYAVNMGFYCVVVIA